MSSKRRDSTLHTKSYAKPNITHHWWIGALLMLYTTGIAELYWLGFGLFIDDLPVVNWVYYVFAEVF